ncbi:MAG TPA: hypothetical protein VII47_15025 [Actinomycetota bacterium]
MSERPVDDKDLDEVSELFGAEPSAFVEMRDALARRLRAAGDREAAAEVAKLRKPTAVAWALNQLSRREGGQVEALLRTDDRIRELMQSGGRGSELRKATDERREIVRGLAHLASAILAGAGHKPTPASGDKIFETLQAVATDAGAREALRLGRLSGDVRPSGFGESLMAPAPRAGAGGEGAREAEEARQHLEDLAEARRTARRRAEEAEEAGRTAERLAREAGEAERRAARARKEADRAAADHERASAAAQAAATALAELEARS